MEIIMDTGRFVADSFSIVDETGNTFVVRKEPEGGIKIEGEGDIAVTPFAGNSVGVYVL